MKELYDQIGTHYAEQRQPDSRIHTLIRRQLQGMSSMLNFQELLDYDRTIFPKMEEIGQALGAINVQPIPIPADCCDGFLGAYWRRPDAYLQETVRAGISSFSHIPMTDSRFIKLRQDIESDVWGRRNRRLLSTDELDIGYRLVTSDFSET